MTPLEAATLRSYALAVRQAALHASQPRNEKHQLAEQSLTRADRMLAILRAARPPHWRPLRMAKHACELALREPSKSLRAVEKLLSELPAAT